MGPQQKIVKDVRLNPIKTCEDLRWDPKKETIKYSRWNPFRTPKRKLLRMLEGTLSKHLMPLNGTTQKKLLRTLDRII